MRTRPRGKYRRLLAYAVPRRRQWAVLIGVSIGTTAVSLAQPWPLKVLADNVLGRERLTGLAGHLPGSSSTNGILVLVVVAGLVVVALGNGLDVVSTRTWVKAGQGMVFDLEADMFDALQRRSLLFHTRNPVGDSIARTTGDSWVVYDLFEAFVFTPLQSTLTTVAMVLLMADLDLGLTAISMATAPVMVVSALLLGRPVRQAGRERREVESIIHAHVQQTLAGLPVVQAFGREPLNDDRFREVAARAIDAQRKTILATGFSTLGAGLVGAVGTGAVLFVGAHHVLAGHLTVGGLLVFAAYLTSLQSQLAAYARIYTKAQSLRGSLDRVVEVLDALPEVADVPGAPALDRVRGHVVVENASFGFDADRPVLTNVTLHAAPGETVAIVGPTGAGKSTLASLVLRFFDPWEGRVTIDGHDLRDVQVASVRRQVSLVLQESFLFPISLADNIAYGRPDATPDEIIHAAKAANAHDFIARLPDGYDTIVGERGATLSGGERQRVAIARALLKDAPVLILDEPTSALDAETEHSLLEALERLMHGRTTLVIAHRLSTIRNADRIVVLQDGQIIETGTHHQLLTNEGLYSRLHTAQHDRGIT